MEVGVAFYFHTRSYIPLAPLGRLLSFRKVDSVQTLVIILCELDTTLLSLAPQLHISNTNLY